MKIEKLIHLQLSTHRLRENLQNGRCNEGKGCASRHQEWFDISLNQARSAVERWVEWMRITLPYDREGYLKKEWVGRVKTLRGADIDGVEWVEWMTSEVNPYLTPAFQSSASRRVARGTKQEEILLNITETPTMPHREGTKEDPDFDIDIKTDKTKITSSLARRRVIRAIKQEEASTITLPMPNRPIVPTLIKTEDTCPVVICY